MDKSEPVVIMRVWTEGEASVIKSLLEAYEIPSHYTPELPTRIYPVSSEDVPRIRIFVPAAQADEAREILNVQCEPLSENI
jgi:hypothetical protein